MGLPALRAVMVLQALQDLQVPQFQDLLDLQGRQFKDLQDLQAPQSQDLPGLQALQVSLNHLASTVVAIMNPTNLENLARTKLENPVKNTPVPNLPNRATRNTNTRVEMENLTNLVLMETEVTNTP